MLNTCSRSLLGKQLLLSPQEQLALGRQFCFFPSSGTEQLHACESSRTFQGTWPVHLFIDEPRHGKADSSKTAAQPSSLLQPSPALFSPSLLQQSILSPLQFPAQQPLMSQTELEEGIQVSMPLELCEPDDDALDCSRGNTYQPSRRKRINKHGLGKRLSMPAQRLTLLRRMRKGRHRLTVDHYL